MLASRSSGSGFDFTSGGSGCGSRCRLVIFPRNVSVGHGDLVDESLDSAARRLAIVGGRVGGVFVDVTYSYSFGIVKVHVIGNIVDEFGLFEAMMSVFDDVGRCKHVYVNVVGDNSSIECW